MTSFRFRFFCPPPWSNRVFVHTNNKDLTPGLLGYAELPVSAEHALRVDSLPLLPKDPFDRLLLAQSRVEGLLLLTGDAAVAQYGEGTLSV